MGTNHFQTHPFTNFQAYFGRRRPFLWSVNCSVGQGILMHSEVQYKFLNYQKMTGRSSNDNAWASWGLLVNFQNLWQIWFNEVFLTYWRTVFPLKIEGVPACVFSLSGFQMLICYDLLRLPNSPKDTLGKKKSSGSSGSSEFDQFDLSETFHNLVSPSFPPCAPQAPPHWSWVSPGPFLPWRCWSSSPLHSDP